MKKHIETYLSRLLIVLCFTCTSLLHAQTSVSIASGVQLITSGSVQVSVNNAAILNNGIIMDNTATINILGTGSFSGAGTTNVNNLVFSTPGETITVNGATVLNVKGALTNDGIINGTGTLSLSGSNAQTVSGTYTINNLDVNNNAGATVNSSAKITVKNVLSITAGTLATGDSVVLNSDSIATARIAPITAAGAGITGKVQVRQYIAGGHRAFRFWGHPFSTDISLDEIQSHIDITGTGGTTNGFTPTLTNAPSCFRYNPLVGNSSLGYDPGWRAFTSTHGTADSNMFHKYQGIRLFIRGQKTQGLNGLPYTPAATTIGMSGPVNQGPQTIHLKKGSSDLQDYNQISNPYPSPVDIGTVVYHAWQHGNINGSAIYVWNPYLGSVGQFMAVPITSGVPYYLQAYSSFQVRAMHNNDSLNFTENDKVSTYASNLLRTATDHLSLTIYDADYHPWDMLSIQFNDNATDGEDNSYDALKPSGPAALNFYSWSADKKKMNIDARPYKDNMVVPLGITCSSAQGFTIKAEGVNTVNGPVYLHDKLLNQYTQLTEGTEYHFVITADKTTQGDNRFELTTESREPLAAANGLQVSLQPNPATTEVSINFTNCSAEEVSVRIIDISGLSIYNKKTGTQQKGKIIVPLNDLTAGIYMVELTSGDEKVVQRLVKE